MEIIYPVATVFKCYICHIDYYENLVEIVKFKLYGQCHFQVKADVTVQPIMPLSII